MWVFVNVRVGHIEKPMEVVMRITPDFTLPTQYDGQFAFTLADLRQMKLGERSYIYEEIKQGRLTATKRGRYTVFLRPNLLKWLAAMPTIQPRPSVDKHKAKQEPRARPPVRRITAAE